MTPDDREPTIRSVDLTDSGDLDAGVVTDVHMIGENLIVFEQLGNQIQITRAQLWELLDWVFECNEKVTYE